MNHPLYERLKKDHPEFIALLARKKAAGMSAKEAAADPEVVQAAHGCGILAGIILAGMLAGAFVDIWELIKIVKDI